MTAIRPLAAARRSGWHDHGQRGAALLMALIIVTLVTTLAASMVWQQWRAVQVEAAERARAQSAWILIGALDWARVILREDGRPSAEQVDHLGEPWAVPLAEARLSTFLAVDESNAEDAPDTFLSGVIVDAQSRYDLRNLLLPNKKTDKDQLRVLQALCTNLNVAQNVATLIATGLENAEGGTLTAVGTPASGATGTSNEARPLKPMKVEQLSWLGVDAESLKRLEPYVWLSPDNQPTKVNLNTAPREVLAAVIPKLDLGTAERLVQIRGRAPFKKTSDAEAQMGGIKLENARVSVTTNYFVVTGRLRLANQVLEQRSLVRRTSSPLVVVPITREWVNSADPG